jgi:dGTPase
MTTSDLFRLSGAYGVSEATPFRSAYRQDYGRLIHSPAFRRLQNKTQLYPGQESDFFRNRLTHSIEVSNVAVGIVEKLNATEDALNLESDKIDADLVAFAGLAHDLGHPPFGHNGEKALDDLMKAFGGFEGNAQTLRILTRIEKKAGDSESPLADEFGRLGLDLTFRSLASILKYDNKIPSVRGRDEPLCKGYYGSEELLVKTVVKHVSGGMRRSGKFKTIECSIMDLADDIAYSTYDLEDTLKSGFLTPIDLIALVRKDSALRRTVKEKVLRASDGRNIDFDIQEYLEEIFFEGGVAEVYPLDAVAISNGYCRDGYTRAELTSWLVGSGVSSVVYEHDSHCPVLSRVRLTDSALIGVEILKNLNYELTIRSPRLAVVQHRGYDVVKSIFEALFVNKYGFELLPSDYRDLFDQARSDTSKARVICDFIAGMTDRYAVEFYSRLYDGDESIFKPF